MIRESRIIALIPARSGSKGVPNKNLIKIGGHSLLDWSITACKKSCLIQRTIVSTDSIEYSKHALKLGAEVPFLRPREISGDNSTDIQFINHALNWFATNGGDPTFIVHIRPTTPFRDPSIIDEAIHKIMNTNDSTITSLRSVHKMSETAYKCFELNKNNFLKPAGFSNIQDIDLINDSRQSFPDTYVANGYVDILLTDHIRRSGKIHGKRVMPFLTSEAIELDTEEDLRYLEYKLDKDKYFFKILFN